jgi:hypothetical protein
MQALSKAQTHFESKTSLASLAPLASLAFIILNLRVHIDFFLNAKDAKVLILNL